MAFGERKKDDTFLGDVWRNFVRSVVTFGYSAELPPGPNDVREIGDASKRATEAERDAVRQLYASSKDVGEMEILATGRAMPSRPLRHLPLSPSAWSLRRDARTRLPEFARRLLVPPAGFSCSSRGKRGNPTRSWPGELRSSWCAPPLLSLPLLSSCSSLLHRASRQRCDAPHAYASSLASAQGHLSKSVQCSATQAALMLKKAPEARAPPIQSHIMSRVRGFSSLTRNESLLVVCDDQLSHQFRVVLCFPLSVPACPQILQLETADIARVLVYLKVVCPKADISRMARAQPALRA